MSEERPPNGIPEEFPPSTHGIRRVRQRMGPDPTGNPQTEDSQGTRKQNHKIGREIIVLRVVEFVGGFHIVEIQARNGLSKSYG